MPKASPKPSTARRHKLADFIENFGEEMVKSCSTCAKHNRSCRVHARSGKCSECLRRGQRCDIKVTQSEWERLKSEKARLRREIKDAYEAQERARQVQEKAREEQTAAFAREMRLRQQMDLLDKRAEDAIAVEEATIRELEAEEAREVLDLQAPSDGFMMNLSPSTWSALDGFPNEYWDDSFLPAGTVAGASGSG